MSDTDINALVTRVMQRIGWGFSVEVHSVNGNPELHGYRITWIRRIRCEDGFVDLGSQDVHATTLEGALRQVLAVEERRDQQLAKRYAGAGGEGGAG